MNNTDNEKVRQLELNELEAVTGGKFFDDLKNRLWSDDKENPKVKPDNIMDQHQRTSRPPVMKA